MFLILATFFLQGQIRRQGKLVNHKILFTELMYRFFLSWHEVIERYGPPDDEGFYEIEEEDLPTNRSIYTLIYRIAPIANALCILFALAIIVLHFTPYQTAAYWCIGFAAVTFLPSALQFLLLGVRILIKDHESF
jgi:hypothetical protein